MGRLPVILLLVQLSCAASLRVEKAASGGDEPEMDDVLEVSKSAESAGEPGP